MPFKGPLEVDEITKSSCRLSWKAPEDNGGKPITGYVVEKMDKASGRWVPVSRTDPNVTECPVKGLQEGHEYLFRVKAVNDEGESEPLESDAAIQAKDPYGEAGRSARLHDLHGQSFGWPKRASSSMHAISLTLLGRKLDHSQMRAKKNLDLLFQVLLGTSDTFQLI